MACILESISIEIDSTSSERLSACEKIGRLVLIKIVFQFFSQAESLSDGFGDCFHLCLSVHLWLIFLSCIYLCSSVCQKRD
jgi:hypothetical protein